VIAVIVIVVVIIVVVCGVIFGGIIAFLLLNKIVRRHLHYLQKKQIAESVTVVDLDNAAQVGQATSYPDIEASEMTFTQPRMSSKPKAGYDAV